MQNKITNILNTICITCLLLDSGGTLGLRNISFLIIFSFALKSIFTNKSINVIFLAFYVFLLISILPGIFISVANGIPISVITVWVIAFLMLPVFYLYIKGSNINNSAFVISGAILSCVIIILFFGRIFNISPINNINDYIKDHSEGFFGDKNFLSGDILPNVYFQGTLSLVICGSLCLQNKNYLVYILILIALILAPSRFGFMMLIVWGLFIFLRKSATRLVVLPFLFIILYYLLTLLPFGFELFSIFNGGGDGLEVRNGHIESLRNFFSNDPWALFTGAGPGSLFYTKGTGNIQDNIEISQFEYIRKYGVISFAFFNILYFGPFLAKNKNIYILGALVIYYVVAFSNPVLFSIFSMLFLAYAYLKNFGSQETVINDNLYEKSNN